LKLFQERHASSTYPAEIYLKRGVGELFPLLVRALDQSQIVAMQFLRVSRVRVTVRTQAYREELLKSQFMFEDVVIPVSPADRVAKVVYVRDLPLELSAESVQPVFSVFGEVYSVQFVYHKEFPTICSGTRTVLMSVQVPVSSTVNVLGFECRVVSWPTAFMFHLSRAWSLTSILSALWPLSALYAARSQGSGVSSWPGPA